MSIESNIRIDELPEIGTPEAAVHSCISLISGMCDQSEHIMAYWLDLYYQVRLRFEVERNTRPDEQVMEDPAPAAASASPEAQSAEEKTGAEQSAPPQRARG